jgi:hypothetical protein
LDCCRDSEWEVVFVDVMAERMREKKGYLSVMRELRGGSVGSGIGIWKYSCGVPDVTVMLTYL